MQVLTSKLIKLSEERAVESGAFSYKELMQSAGTGAGKIIDEKYNCKNKKIAVFCGNGNNGGDGFVLADYLKKLGATVSVFLPLGKPVTENAAFYFENVKELVCSDFCDCYDIIIDAVLGIGLNRAVSQEISALFRRLNNSTAVKIAVDIPSGVEADSGNALGTAFKADLTVTFIALKPGHVLPEGSDYCGERIVCDIGVTPIESEYYVNQKPVFKKRRHNSHKGDFGTALLICGSYGMAGAAILSARGALRSGVGIAKCVLCDGIYPAFTAAVPEAVCVPSKQTENGCLESSAVNIEKLCENADALLFGCGVTVSPDTEKILQNILKFSKIPTVIDADGINLIKDNIELLRNTKAPVVITPHPGEMARLVGKTVKEIEQNRIFFAKKFASENNCTVVLKGADTIIADKNGEITFNLTGNPGMATGGSGDVLAGITVSLCAQGYNAPTAAKYAVYIHGNAGDKAALKRGEISLLPSDIIKEL